MLPNKSHIKISIVREGGLICTNCNWIKSTFIQPFSSTIKFNWNCFLQEVDDASSNKFSANILLIKSSNTVYSCFVNPSIFEFLI